MPRMTSLLAAALVAGTAAAVPTAALAAPTPPPTIGAEQGPFTRGGPGGVDVSKHAAAPGTTVFLTDSLCGHRATATSRALGTVHLTPGANVLVGKATVRHVQPGTYTVTFRCPDNGRVGHAKIAVTGRRPSGPAHAGVGGTGAPGDPANGAELSLSAVLIAGAAGAALRFSRRRAASEVG
jgi:hypothetical protein